MYGVVAGLVILAAGSDAVLADAHASHASTAGASSSLYLAPQAVYFRVETGTGWRERAGGATLLGLAAIPAYWLPAPAVVAVHTALLLLSTGYLGRVQPAAESPAA